jgi:endonuclease YncB( thermonuclease family)
MNRIGTTLFCAVLLCVNGPACAEGLGPNIEQEFTARIIAVLDGDTVLVRREGGLVKIRLAEIDAPEKAQTFGETSKRSLSDMVMGKQVRIVSQTMDQYGRMVAHLSINDLDVNAEQIRRGMAWEYSNYHSNKALIALQSEAKQAPRGLWQQDNPMPPWKWRKLHPFTQHGKAAIPDN